MSSGTVSAPVTAATVGQAHALLVWVLALTGVGFLIEGVAAICGLLIIAFVENNPYKILCIVLISAGLTVGAGVGYVARLFAPMGDRERFRSHYAFFMGDDKEWAIGVWTTINIVCGGLGAVVLFVIGVYASCVLDSTASIARMWMPILVLITFMLLLIWSDVTNKFLRLTKEHLTLAEQERRSMLEPNVRVFGRSLIVAVALLGMIGLGAVVATHSQPASASSPAPIAATHYTSTVSQPVQEYTQAVAQQEQGLTCAEVQAELSQEAVHWNEAHFRWGNGSSTTQYMCLQPSRLSDYYEELCDRHKACQRK